MVIKTRVRLRRAAGTDGHTTGRQPVIEAFVHALDVVFLAAVPVAALAFLLTLRLPEHRLRGHDDMHGSATSQAADPSSPRVQSAASPVGGSDEPSHGEAELPQFVRAAPGMGEAIEEEIEHRELR